MTIEDCIGDFKEALRKIECNGKSKFYDLTEGDCGNFAEALAKTFGGTVVCSYVDDEHLNDGNPSHCMLRNGNNMFDGGGSYSIDDGYAELEDYALGSTFVDYNEDSEIVEYSPQDFYGWKRIRELEKVGIYSKILQRCRSD